MTAELMERTASDARGGLEKPSAPLSVPVLRVLFSAAGAGLLLGLVDLALAWAQGSGGIRGLLLPLATLSFAAALGFVVFVALRTMLGVLGRVVPVVRSSLDLALVAGLLATGLDLVLLRGEQVFGNPARAWASPLVGLLIGVLAYIADARGKNVTGARLPGIGERFFARGAACCVAIALAVLGLRSLGVGRSALAVTVVVALSAGLIWSLKRPSNATRRRRGRSIVLGGFVLALASALPWISSTRGESAARAIQNDHPVPRVILIVVDTLRADALSCASPSAPPTPGIDRWAEGAFRFTHARSAAPWTLPSVCSILTGLSPLVHGAVGRDSVLPHRLPTLAERLADAGYRTAAIGHNYVLSRTRRLDRGFDEYHFAAQDPPPARSLGFFALGRLRYTRTKGGPDAKTLSARALSWIEEHADQDFFLWLHYYDPHLSYAPPPAFLPSGVPPPAVGTSVGSEHVERIRGGYFAPKSDERRWIRRLYDGEVRYLDQELGAFFERLEEMDLFEDALIVLTSDHGEEFWEHEGFEHGHTVYEELLRVPLIIKLPRQEQGAVVDRPVTLESVAPSVFSLCGIDYAPADFSAPTLFQVDGSIAESASEPAFLSTGLLYFQDRLSLLQGDWKYVRFLSTGREELYDLGADPSELVSRSFLEPQELAEARRRCDELLEAAQQLKQRYGVMEGQRTTLSRDELQQLRDIGYAK